VRRWLQSPAVDFHKIWIDQCDAGRAIRERFGLEKALGYVVGEKLLNFVQAAETHPEFAREIPNFIEEVKDIFEPHELRAYLDGVRRVGPEGHILDDETYEFARDAGMYEQDVVRAAEDVVRMGRIRELLLG
jgi:hypothetical protein